MSEIIQIQKLNGWWEEIIFISWNIFQFEIILPMECHHFPCFTMAGGWDSWAVNLWDIAICTHHRHHRLTALWRYLCDCDPLGAFGRQRWAQVANESRGMSPSSQIKHSNFQTPAWENLQFWPEPSEMMGVIRNLAPGLLMLISLTQCCSLHSGHCSMQQSLCCCADCRDYQSQHCKWANNGV